MSENTEHNPHKFVITYENTINKNIKTEDAIEIKEYFKTETVSPETSATFPNLHDFVNVKIENPFQSFPTQNSNAGKTHDSCTEYEIVHTFSQSEDKNLKTLENSNQMISPTIENEQLNIQKSDQSSKSKGHNLSATTHPKKYPKKDKFHCHRCKKGFKFISLLKAHTKSHTSEKPYGCKICEKVFTTVTNLNLHERLHKEKLGKKDASPAAGTSSQRCQKKLPSPSHTKCEELIRETENTKKTYNLKKVKQLNNQKQLNETLQNQKIIMENQNIIMQELNRHRTLLDFIITREKIEGKLYDDSYIPLYTSEYQIEEENEEEEDIFPINDIEKMNRLELELTDETKLNKMIERKSKICGVSGKMMGKTSCYALIDYFFDRQFLLKFSWCGGSKDSERKFSFKQYKNIMKVFFMIVQKADIYFSITECEYFFKSIIKNARKRAENVMKEDCKKRMSAPKNRPEKLSYKKRKMETENIEMEQESSWRGDLIDIKQEISEVIDDEST